MLKHGSEQLNQDEFWNTAFESDAPFIDSYKTTFRRGLEQSIVSALEIHREALYYLNDGAIWPVVYRLIEIAADHPEADFIESLGYFLNSQEQRSRLRSLVEDFTPEERQSMLKHVLLLQNSLSSNDDKDLAADFNWFASLLQGSSSITTQGG